MICEIDQLQVSFSADLPNAKVVLALEYDPRLIYIQIPCTHQEALGPDTPEKDIPNISISLVAQPKRPAHKNAELAEHRLH